MRFLVAGWQVKLGCVHELAHGRGDNAHDLRQLIVSIHVSVADARDLHIIESTLRASGKPSLACTPITNRHLTAHSVANLVDVSSNVAVVVDI